MQLTSIDVNNYGDRLSVITDTTWEEYKNLSLPNCLISYKDNVITIMSPGRNHEIISDLVRAIIWGMARKHDIALFTFNQTRLTYEDKEGKEPDVAYCMGSDKDKPDLAVEINITSGSINDLTKYQYLNIAEVWIWWKDEIKFFGYTKKGYKQMQKSKFLSDLTSDMVTDIINSCFGKNLLNVDKMLP